MDWENRSIVLGTQDYNSDMMLLSVLSQEHGIRKGLVKITKANKIALNTGNILQLKWYGRMENHLGKFTVQSHEIISHYIYQKKHQLLALLSICELFKHSLPEKDPQESLFLQLSDFLYALKYSDPMWINMLVALEIELLSKSGFGFDLSKCAANGTKEDLTYISPKTGRAVSKDAGEPYKDKLFKIPKIFIDSQMKPENQDLANALSITRYFFMKHLFAGKANLFPNTRVQLENSMSMPESVNTF